VDQRYATSSPCAGRPVFKWAMLDLNQRPPPCKLGQSFPGGYSPVGKSRLSKRLLAFLAPSFSCSVLVCPAPVAARLQRLTLLRPAPFSPTLSGSGKPLVRESCAARCAEQASPTQEHKKAGAPIRTPALFLSPLSCREPSMPEAWGSKNTSSSRQLGE
jgi:hypothetical protein